MFLLPLIICLFPAHLAKQLSRNFTPANMVTLTAEWLQVEIPHTVLFPPLTNSDDI